MGKDLTDKQRLIYEFIKNKINSTGLPPTVREVAEYFEMTAKGAYDHMKAIEKKGFIRCTQNKSRAIELLIGKNEDDNSVMIPILGSIAAGLPVLAEENIDGFVPFPAESVSSGEYFALRVKGESMIEAGILDRDIVLIRVQQNAENGDIIAALIDEEATLKRYSRIGSEIQLLPANRNYKPIIPNNLSILGILSALYRSY